MKVKWTERARIQRDEVANYIRRQFGAKRKYQFKQEVRNTTNLLRLSPGIGKIDPLFEERPQAYRSVIIGFWDTRLDEEDQASKVK